jgi:hypothetical protein
MHAARTTSGSCVVERTQSTNQPRHPKIFQEQSNKDLKKAQETRRNQEKIETCRPSLVIVSSLVNQEDSHYHHV